MRTLMYLALVAGGLAGCGDDPPETGAFSVAWSLADGAAAPTCTTYQLADVVVTATEVATGDITEISASCATGMLVTPKLPLGAYTLSLEAMGVLGDVAGMTQTTASLVKADLTVPLAAAAITVLPPTAKARPTWTLRKGGAVMTCAQITQQGVKVTVTPAGLASVTDIWDCAETNTTTDIPYGSFTAQADALGAGDQPFASSPVTTFAAQRGIVQAALTIEIP